MSKREISLNISLRSGKKVPKSDNSEGDNQQEDPKGEPSTNNQDSQLLDIREDIEELVDERESNNSPNHESETDPNPRAKMSTFNLQHAIKLIPEYDGNPATLHRFLQVAKIQYARATEEDDKLEFLDLIKSKLSGRAYNVILRYNEYQSWDELKMALEKHFSKERSIQIVQTELFNIRQSYGESVAHFSERIEKLLEELDIASSKGQTIEGGKAIRLLNEKTAINNFKSGLRNPLKLILKATQHESLRAAIDMALEEERLLEADNKREGSGFRSFPVRKNTGQETKQNKSNPNKNSTLTNNNHSKTADYLRNQVTVVDDDRKVKFCRYCKNKGHEIQECRKRQFNNNKSRTNRATTSNANSIPGNDSSPGSNDATARAADLK